ncbi:hypothetical protein B0T24DRAFT_644151 [Lasiosphaeria ovina]|uniref:Uncharacterized protein n=1 Tax=Lasiosphaeria ovina TaxID=92902 RepID=A0AAE0JSL6_9PEZI|nr:hypothetical protein B0T24DRAFT_644151 [Lasiosphaeria ovina]
MTSLEIERKLLEVIRPHERITALKGFTDKRIYLESTTNGTVAEYMLESGKPLPSVKQRLAWCREAAEGVTWIYAITSPLLETLRRTGWMDGRPVHR